MDRVISIVIPYYRTPRGLFLRCMESILAARLPDVEVIVVDDGSPEEYRPVPDSYAGVESVRVLHVPNAGVSAARNRGVREAAGKWIMFVDSDDYVNPEALKAAAVCAREQSGDVVLFSGGSDVNGVIRYNTTFLKPGINYAATESGRVSLMESALAVGKLPRGYIQYYTLGAPYSKLLRTDFLRQNGLAFDQDVKLAEDALFSLYVYQAARDITFVDQNLYYYVYNPESVTRRYRPGFSADMDVFFDRVKAFMTRFGLEKELERAYYIRAQFEIDRCIRLEYFHPDNKQPGAAGALRRFIAKEPYRTALKSEYLLEGGRTRRLRLFLLRHGMVRTMRAFGKAHGFLFRLFR